MPGSHTESSRERNGRNVRLSPVGAKGLFRARKDAQNGGASGSARGHFDGNPRASQHNGRVPRSRMEEEDPPRRRMLVVPGSILSPDETRLDQGLDNAQNPPDNDSRSRRPGRTPPLLPFALRPPSWSEADRDRCNAPRIDRQKLRRPKKNRSLFIGFCYRALTCGNRDRFG